MMPTSRLAVLRVTLLAAGLSAWVSSVIPTDAAAQPARMPPAGWPASPKRYDAILVERDRMIPTRDGKRMATDIFRPGRHGVAVAEPFPVLLNRTPYDKSELHSQAQFFAERGYVVAVQDTRGRYKSEGVFLKVQPVDATDGYDIIEWLAKQPYSTGAVGMWGTSFSAHMQAGAAQLHPPSLKTLVINMGGMSNAWDDGVRYRGAYEMGRQLTWAWSQMLADARSESVRSLLQREKVEDWYGVQPMRRGLNPLSVVPEYERWYMDFFEHADYDAFWKDPMLAWDEHYPGTSDVPMIQIGGWYDILLAGTFKNFVDFATDFHVRWFDHHLKGAASGPERKSPVRLFVMGTGDGHKDRDGRLFHGGYWRNAEAWPLPGTREVPYYFHADGSLTTRQPVAPASATTYTFDPRDPVPTVGGGASARLKDGAFDQREDPRFPPSAPPYLPLRTRPDVVVFQTEPLTQDVEVIGPIRVVLYASASTVDADFTAKLVDVYPSSDAWPAGFDLNLTDAIIRGRYRATRDHAELLEPGRVYQFTIEPFPTANVFKKGHRIRVDISSSNFPRFDVNSNTGEPLGRNRRMVTTDITVHHSAAWPSHIVLPLAPARP